MPEQPAPGMAPLEPTLVRIRLIFYGLAGLWLAMLAVTVFAGHLEGALPPGTPPLWVSQLALGVVAAAHTLAGWWIQPRRKASWGLAVCVLCLSLMNCVSFPVALWGLRLLFKKEVLAGVVGGAFRKGSSAQ